MGLASTMKDKNKNFNVPNALTLMRILLIVPFVVYYTSDHVLRAVLVLAVSGLTDVFDGMIARRFNQFTELGQMLDPLADKLTQGAVAVCFAVKQPILIPFLAVLILKELAMVVGGIFLLLFKKKKPGGSQWYGKIATVLFYISFGTIVALKGIWQFESAMVSMALLSVTAAVMIYAFVRYAKIYLKIIHSDDPQYRMDIDEVIDKKRAK